MESTVVSIECSGIKLEVAANIRIAGEDLIFCIHGLGCSNTTFDGVWTHGAYTGYSILAPDLPGFGDSASADGFSYDLKNHAEVCRILLARVPNSRVHIIGHSMGGAVGLFLADTIRDRLISFINVEGNLIGQDCSVSRPRTAVTFENFRTKQLPGLILATALSDEPGRRLWSKLLKKADPRALYLSSRSLVQWSDSGVLLKQFMAIDCKKVYVYGESNSFMKVLRMMGTIPVLSISKSGHFPMIDNPDEFYNSIAPFINNSC